MKSNEYIFIFLKLMLYFCFSKNVETKTKYLKNKIGNKIGNSKNNSNSNFVVKNNIENSDFRQINTNNNQLNTLNFNTTLGVGECSINNCYLPYGICLNQTTCMCMPDYANYPVNIQQFFLKNKILNLNKNESFQSHSNTYLYCSYKKKSIVMAGLLELFLPLGLGHFYAGHLFLAWLKFFYNLLIYIFGCILHFKKQWNDPETYFDLMLMCIVFTCVIPIWNVLDLFLFFTGNYKDGNGIEMA
jgi:hypothetical protein